LERVQCKAQNVSTQNKKKGYCTLLSPEGLANSKGFGFKQLINE
jgi:hypothetical protein